MREFQTKPTVYSLFISIANYLWLGLKISFSGQLDYSSNTGYPVHCHLLHCLLFQEIKSFSRRVWRVSYSLTCRYWSESRPWFFIKALTYKAKLKEGKFKIYLIKGKNWTFIPVKSNFVELKTTWRTKLQCSSLHQMTFETVIYWTRPDCSKAS